MKGDEVDVAGERSERGGSPPRDDGAELSLEGRLRRLDEILGALESDELELERALALFEEGVRHVREAERLLAEAELRVDELLGPEGALVRPFPGEGDQG